jgi:DNA helicase-2/ATP-dependent DNA helicase PcrA
MHEAAIAGEIAARFDHVLVDEYQDTNKLQASVLLALRPNGKGLTVVGDDAQSIYSFRAATVRNILDFPGHFGPRADVVTLEQNYRSTQPILAAANAVIELAQERFTKSLWSERKSAERPLLVGVRDEADQALYVVEKVLESREQGLALRTQAVLFRASHHSGPLEVELTRRNIPFVKFGGLKFLEAAHRRRPRKSWSASASAPIRSRRWTTLSHPSPRPSTGRHSSKRLASSAARQ